MLGTRNLGDILSEREAIASEMQQGLDSATAPWGVLVERVEVDNFIINIYNLYLYPAKLGLFCSPLTGLETEQE